MKKELNIEIGSRVRKSRERLGYSREALAEKAELATSFIGSIELGTGSFSAESLIKLCKTLSVSADYILFGVEQPTDLSEIDSMLSGIDPKYLPQLQELLSAYLKTIALMNE